MHSSDSTKVLRRSRECSRLFGGGVCFPVLQNNIMNKIRIELPTVEQRTLYLAYFY